jgi:hypothetical protein
MIHDWFGFTDGGNHCLMTKEVREPPIPENGVAPIHSLREETRFKKDREEGFNESRGH